MWYVSCGLVSRRISAVDSIVSGFVRSARADGTFHVVAAVTSIRVWDVRGVHTTTRTFQGQRVTVPVARILISVWFVFCALRWLWLGSAL